MKGSFQLADLQVTLDGSMKELAQAQGVEREFRRACRRLRTQSGAENVFFRVDTGLEGENGSFHKFRLRSYAPDSPEVYTIDCGITDENPLGIYVGWNAPIEIYNRETEQVRTIDPETGEVTKGRGSDSSGGGSAANPSGDGRASSTQQNGREQHASEKVYDQSDQGGVAAGAHVGDGRRGPVVDPAPEVRGEFLVAVPEDREEVAVLPGARTRDVPAGLDDRRPLRFGWNRPAAVGRVVPASSS